MNLSPASFLKTHWQKKPLLVRGAFPGFRDPVTPNDLAGLACLPEVESRLVMERGGRKPWQVTHGPQDPARLRRLWAALAADAESRDPLRRAAYLHGGCAGPYGAPPRSGYYLGYLIVRDRLARGATIADLTRTPTRHIYEEFARRIRDEG